MKFLAACQLIVEALETMIVRSGVLGTQSRMVHVVVVVPAEPLPPAKRAVGRW